MAERFPGVEVVRRPEQGGFCRAVNTGLKSAHGTIVQVLNDDTEVSPGFAEPVLRRFAQNPAIVAISPLVRTGDRIDSMGDHFWPWGVAQKRGHGQPLLTAHRTDCSIRFANGTASFYRRDILHACGGFAEELGAYFDDIDLSFRLRRWGQIWYEPACEIHHHVSASYGPPRGDLLVMQSRNEELVYWRNLPLPALLAWLPAHVAVVALKAYRRWCEGTLREFWRGRCQAWASFAAIRRYRAAQAGAAVAPVVAPVMALAPMSRR
jgi:GT2 family glycosyltransferase